MNWISLAAMKRLPAQFSPELKLLHPRSVNRDMKSCSTLLGWIGILIKSCVVPQVFYGSKRVAGRAESLRDGCQRFGAFRTPR